jgi:hypothetical protein
MGTHHLKTSIANAVIAFLKLNVTINGIQIERPNRRIQFEQMSALR